MRLTAGAKIRRVGATTMNAKSSASLQEIIKSLKRRGVDYADLRWVEEAHE